MTTPSQSDPVASPCIRNCCLDEHDVCMGCGRSLAEIIRWGNATASEKSEILARSLARSEQRGSRS